MPKKRFPRPHKDGWYVHEETRTEAALAEILKRRGWRFQQEAALGPYHVDFLVEGRVVVEVDGSSHLVSGARERDAHRDRELHVRGYAVVRIPAEAIAHRTHQPHIRKIEESLKRKRPDPEPLWGEHRQRWEKVRKRLSPIRTGAQPGMDEMLREDEELMKHWLDTHPVVDKDAKKNAKRRGSRRGAKDR